MTGLPRIDIVVPTKDRIEPLRECLRSLAGQDYAGKPWRVVVVNDGGADPEPALAAAGLPVVWMNNPGRGPAAARNAGVRTSDADLIAFLDDDCVAGSGWLRELAAGLWETPWAAAAGQTLNRFPGEWPARAYQFYMDFYREYQRFPNGDLYLVMSNNAVYRRDAFLEAGGFNESFPRPGAEDLELSHRLCAAGRRQGYLPQAVIRHAHPRTAGRYLRQQYQYGRGYAVFKASLAARGIPLQIGQRRRPRYHLALARAMLRGGPGLRESALVWLGIAAHTLGSRREAA